MAKTAQEDDIEWGACDRQNGGLIFDNIIIRLFEIINNLTLQKFLRQIIMNRSYVRQSDKICIEVRYEKTIKENKKKSDDQWTEENISK